MSDIENSMLEKMFTIEIAKQGRAICKRCRKKCVQNELRIAKLIPNPTGAGKMKTWYHVDCIFQVFLKQRQSTKRIETSQDVDGWELLSDQNKKLVLKEIEECNRTIETKLNKSSKKSKNLTIKNPQLNYSTVSEDCVSVSSDNCKDVSHKDNCFRKFRTVVANVSNAKSSSERTSIFRETFSKGSDGTGFKGDIWLWCKLLLPAIVRRVFHLQSKQLVKIFSRLFDIAEETILEHPEQNDIGQTIQYFFEQNKKFKPAKNSTLTIGEVDQFLETLTVLQKKEEQFQHFKSFIKKCTGNDLKVVIRLIKHDLRMNAGAKHILEAIHPDAYQLYRNSSDVRAVINTCWPNTPKTESPKTESPKLIRSSPKRKYSHSEVKLANNKLKIEKKEEPDFKEEVKLTSHKPVPNYFENVKLYLEDGVTERHSESVRYVIAFGGTVLEAGKYEEATHVLHLNDTVSEPTVLCSNSARHIIVEWIQDTVAKESLQDCRPYTVRWKPSRKSSHLT